jgi:peptide methionine sulfoxide reductase MsrB
MVGKSEDSRRRKDEVTDDYRKHPELIAALDDRQYAVTQKGATEPAFDSEFWDKKEAGIYVDIVSGEPLFASARKFDGGCGWLSFTVLLKRANVLVNKVAGSLSGVKRPEARARAFEYWGNIDTIIGNRIQTATDASRPTVRLVGTSRRAAP